MTLSNNAFESGHAKSGAPLKGDVEHHLMRDPLVGGSGMVTRSGWETPKSANNR
jgi:hypothetical protein